MKTSESLALKRARKKKKGKILRMKTRKRLAPKRSTYKKGKLSFDEIALLKYMHDHDGLIDLTLENEELYLLLTKESIIEKYSK